MMPFLMRMLNAFAHLHEEREAIGDRHLVTFAIGRDRFAADVLHDEIRPAVRCGAGIENASDGRVSHHRQRLALGVETHHDFRRVHSGLDHLERNLAADGLGLLGQPHLAHPAFADLLQQSVRPDDLRQASAGKGVGAVGSFGEDSEGFGL